MPTWLQLSTTALVALQGDVSGGLQSLKHLGGVDCHILCERRRQIQ